MKERFKIRRTWIATLVALAVGAGASYALYRQLRPYPLPEQLIYGNGHVEGIEVRVSAEVSGLIVKTALVEGQEIKVGNVVAQIDRKQLELERAKAKSEIAAIAHQQREVQEELATAKHHQQMAERDFERYRKLSERAVVSSQQLERSEDALREAAGKVGALGAKIKAVGARLEAANKAVEIIEINIGKTTVLAPISGTVLVRAVEPGEFLPVGGTIGVLVDLQRLELKIFIAEKDIGKIHLNDPARVHVDAFPDRYYDARVIRVDQKAQFTPREIHMPEERTRMVFGVTLSVDNTDATLKPGMPADAWILWMKAAQWPEQLHIP